MVKIIHAPADSGLAEKIKQDLANHAPEETASGQVIAVLSAAAVTDSNVEAAIVASLERGERIIPVIAEPTTLPEIIEHLTPVDFSQGYQFEALRDRLANAGTPMKVRTPSVRKLNRLDGYVLIAFVLFCFVVALFFVAGGAVRNPDTEYAAVETAVVLTRNYYVDANLPRSTQEAAEFPRTVQAAPTALRPILSATATAVAEQ
jgi:hypothetical protein